MHFRCPNCQHPIEIGDSGGAVDASSPTLDAITCPSCNSRFSLSTEEASTRVPLHRVTIGHFEVLEILGEGAFGTVYKCRDPELNRLVAVKIPRDGRVSAETSRMFLREARAAAEIRHPNVVGVYEIGQHENGYYIAVEYIDGVTLSALMKQRTFSPRDAAALLIKLLRGVQLFHDKGIIHRDLKSGNILMDQNSEPHIADFGLARQQGPTEITVTNTGRIVGTPAYMSPEQARGDASALTPASDQYALGVVFYELLTGERPFQASNSRTLLHRIISEEPRRPRLCRAGVPRDLETICLKAMEKNAANRFASVGAMADDLQRYLDGHPIHSRPAGALLRLHRWCRRSPLIAALSAAVCLLLVVTGVLLVWNPGQRIIDPPGMPVHRVRLFCELRGDRVPASPQVNWAVVPLDDKTGEAITSEVRRMSQVGELKVALKPGRYLVVAGIPGFGFAEVYRTVPQDPNSLPTLYACERWTLEASGELSLPGVRVVEERLAMAGMVVVQGGSFTMGGGREQIAAPHPKSVESYLLEPTEVTEQQFQTVLDSAPTTDSAPAPASNSADSTVGDLPRVNLTWLAAADYAEFVGRRLPTEAEYEFAATNRGTTKFPWGDDPTLLTTIQLKPVTESGTDVSSTLTVRNLCSGASEWTADLPVAYPGSDPVRVEPLLSLIPQSRVVRGGPCELRLPQDSTPSPTIARDRPAWSMYSGTPQIGFRCARSIKPRFL